MPAERSYDQRLIGEWMGVYADLLGPEFVISCGDLFHYEGIQSTSDPLLWSNFESIYTHGELQCPWYGVLGNHEYRGNNAGHDRLLAGQPPVEHARPLLHLRRTPGRR